jgi:Spy/CpxP family protein refolding chaperone
VNWTALKPWLLMGLIFGVGMIAGASLVVVFHPEAPHGPPGLQQMRSHWLMHLTHELDLTQDQQTKIEPILTDASNQIEALHHEELDKISGIMDKANEKITPILTAQQQEELKKIRSERDHTFFAHPHSPDEGHRPGAGPMRDHSPGSSHGGPPPES